MSSEWDRQREANIRRNREILASLGLDTPLVEPRAAKRASAPKKAAAAASRKRVAPAVEDSDDADAERPAKLARVQAGAEDAQDAGAGPRRSGRNAGKKMDYSRDGEKVAGARLELKEFIDDDGDDKRAGARGGKASGTEPRYNPKQYGVIPQAPVGTWWPGRMGARLAGIHAPIVAGIFCGPQGAYSIALSGGYEDDIDLGYAFTYTGSGGRDLKGTAKCPKNLRTGPQVKDQTFEGNAFNTALKKSAETKKPVRVIRGFKVPSKYGPVEGYRYDGLYTVEKAWRERGMAGFLVCKFALKRLPGQPALEVRGDDDEEDDAPPDSQETALSTDDTAVEDATTSECGEDSAASDGTAEPADQADVLIKPEALTTTVDETADVQA